eukprot:8985827-Pyramimonas_sp.AAC.1
MFLLFETGWGLTARGSTGASSMFGEPNAASRPGFARTCAPRGWPCLRVHMRSGKKTITMPNTQCDRYFKTEPRNASK